MIFSAKVGKFVYKYFKYVFLDLIDDTRKIIAAITTRIIKLIIIQLSAVIIKTS